MARYFGREDDFFSENTSPGGTGGQVRLGADLCVRREKPRLCGHRGVNKTSQKTGTAMEQECQSPLVTRHLLVARRDTGADRRILVVAVIAVVACNARNARIARNARNAAAPGCVQRRNDVANCPCSVINGSWSGIIRP